MYTKYGKDQRDCEIINYYVALPINNFGLTLKLIQFKPNNVLFFVKHSLSWALGSSPEGYGCGRTLSAAFKTVSSMMASLVVGERCGREGLVRGFRFIH